MRGKRFKKNVGCDVNVFVEKKTWQDYKASGKKERV